MSDDRNAPQGDPLDRLAAEYHLRDPRTRLSIAFGCLDRARRDALDLAATTSEVALAHPSAISDRAIHYQGFISTVTEDDDGDE